MLQWDTMGGTIHMTQITPMGDSPSSLQFTPKESIPILDTIA
jgi:hypothetical protein